MPRGQWETRNYIHLDYLENYASMCQRRQQYHNADFWLMLQICLDYSWPNVSDSHWMRGLWLEKRISCFVTGLDRELVLQPTFNIILKRGKHKQNKTENRFASPTGFWASMSQFPQSIQNRMAALYCKSISHRQHQQGEIAFLLPIKKKSEFTFSTDKCLKKLISVKTTFSIPPTSNNGNIYVGE